MAQVKGTSIYSNFSAGLITEASALNFPENSLSDALNIDISIKGNVKRRRGVDYEASHVMSTDNFTFSNLGNTEAITTFLWEAVDGDSSINFVVLQIGATLYFFDADEASTSANKETFTVNLDTYKAPAYTTMADTEVDMDSGKGALFVTSEKLKPVYIVYTGSGVTTAEVNIEIRDFEGVDSGIEIDENPTTLTNAHEYNLKNQGWEGPDGDEDVWITAYETRRSEYPSNVQQNLSVSDYDLSGGTSAARNLWAGSIEESNWGNTPAPKGHQILDPFNKDRNITGVTGLTVETLDKRPTAIAFYAGRAWYAGEKGDIFYSQIIKNDYSNVGRCYQEADPTSAEDSELVKSDGGVINIPRAGTVLKMIPYGTALIIFASNGIWQVDGVEGAFDATNFRVNEVTKDLNVVSRRGVVSVEGTPVFLTRTGIFIISSDEVTGTVSVQSLTETSIQTFYNNIPETSKANMKGAYDPIDKKIYWLYKTDGSDSFEKYVYDGVLVYDVRLNAFYPWKIARNDATEPTHLADVFLTSVINELALNDDSRTKTYVKYFAIAPNGATTKYTFALFNDDDLLDFTDADSTGTSFDSFLVSGADTQGAPNRDKQLPHVYCYFNRTEQGYTVDGSGASVLTYPSGCLLQARWEWADSDASNKWSDNAQVYRLKNLFPPSGTTLDNGFPVVISKTRVRGNGKALQLKFTNDGNKDFDLVGWVFVYTGDGDD